MSIKYKCNCNLNLNSKFNKNNTQCSSKQAFYNHVTFPSMVSMPPSMHLDRSSSSSIYFDENSEDVRHWAGLFQLEKLCPQKAWHSKCSDPICKLPNELSQVWIFTNQYQEQNIIQIHTDYSESEKPTTFNCSDLAVGKTLAVLYADKTSTLNSGSIMVNFMNYDTCYLFNAPIKLLQEEANRLLRNSDLQAQSQLEECFECGVAMSNLKSCGRCKLAKYCSKECQEKSWLSVHKKLCSQAKTLLCFSSLPRHKFNGHFSFRTENDDSSIFDLALPEYKYSAEFSQLNVKSNVLGALNHNKMQI